MKSIKNPNKNTKKRFILSGIAIFQYMKLKRKKAGLI